MCGCSSNPCGCSDITLPTGPRGYNGWLPITAAIVDTVNLDSDGNSRVVKQIVGWTGGTGTVPTAFLNYYIGPSGYVANIASAQNFRGAIGVGYELTTNTNLNLPIASGSQVLTVNLDALDSAYTIGARIRVSDVDNPTTNYFEGIITAYTGTSLTIEIDYSTQDVDTNINDWNINIAGELPSAFGFDSVAWMEITQASMTIGSTLATNTIDSDSPTGTFDATAFNGASRIRWKQLGRTMIISYFINGVMTIINGAEAIGVRFTIKIPGSKTANSIFDSGSSFLVPSAGVAIANQVYPNTTQIYSSDPTYLITQNFVLTNGGGGGTSGTFLLNGNIVLETTT